jgi:DNA-binding transcriptional ArsR family regulator
MEMQQALIMFDALSQETRLGAFRLLVQAGTEGLAAGDLGERLGAAHNTLSFHLSHLAGAGIVFSRKRGRSVIYTANFDAMRELITFMARDCCSDQFASIRQNGKTGGAIIELAPCCGDGGTHMVKKRR